MSDFVLSGIHIALTCNSESTRDNLMMAQNPQKKGKISFDALKPDFCWNFGLDSMIGENDEDYRKLLRNIFKYNPAMHEFDTDRFTIFDK